MKLKFALCATVVLGALGFSGEARAETLIYVHGWRAWIIDHNFVPCQDSTDCRRYWDESPPTIKDGYLGIPDDYGQLSGDVRHVGWNPAEDDWRYFPVNQAIAVFNLHCRGSNSCSVICHSTGCPITGRALDLYGNGGATWNINRVLTLGSAEGGTELADDLSGNSLMMVGLLFTGWTATTLQTSLVRGAYNHNNTAGVAFFHVAGYDGGSTGTAGLIRGQDDGTVPFHSACGYSKAFTATQCSNDYEVVWKGWYWGTRTVPQWTNHARVQYCGRDGCDKTHSQLKDLQFQALVRKAVP